MRRPRDRQRAARDVADVVASTPAGGGTPDDFLAFLDAPVVSLDGRGRIRFATGSAAWLLDETVDELAGEMLLDRVHVADRVGYLKALGESCNGSGIGRLSVRLRRRDGTYVPVGLGVDGTGSAATTILLRETPEARDEAAGLRRALEAAESSSAAKSHFLAAVSHELRTPLNAIIGFSDILDQEFFGSFENERQKEYVGLIRQSGQHLLEVVNSLLDVSKIEAGRYDLMPERFAVGDAMNAAATSCARRRRARVCGSISGPVARGASVVADGAPATRSSSTSCRTR